LKGAAGDLAIEQAHRRVKLFNRRGQPMARTDWPSSRALYDGHTSRDVELQIQMVDGGRLWMAVSAAPIKPDPDGPPAAVVAFSNITARKRAEAEREGLMQRLVDVQEAERLHFARELHDELGQELTALLIGLKALETTASDGARAERIRELRDIANRMNGQVHHMAGNLRPLILEDLGLLSAIEELALGWGAKLGIDVDLLLDGLDGPIAPQASIALYRVLQEALTNVARHAEASRFSITARRAGGTLRVAVEDDGKGFDPGENGTGRARRNGLIGMRERLAAVGGEFTIESRQGHGTTVYISVPVAEGRETHDVGAKVPALHRG
ncbi:ATP-binding protein, partial [uncultured Aureimonas sp.]|uniref:PAS domain-containing sensor histidine kinase n=1 Tax=uncultured Aureimonas sp. TaxID=1604662 RepID=UPI0025EC9847